VVIGDRPLSQLVPLYRDPRSDMAVTQFEMKAVEKAGLVKFDFLGLKTLSVLDRAAKLLADRGVSVDWLALPLDDPEVYKLLARGDTVGVFQFESEGMRRALGQVRPDCFGDIIALGALYRPGPMDNIPSFANRKHQREAVELLHPLMEPILRETYGIIVYQEQVMQIARTLAGYSLGEADLLRRAMGKKIHAEMVAQKERFAEGADKNGIDKATASAIFDLVLKFANYGFNKSHAAAYALVSFQTAWLKAHHPVEFFVASMAYDITNTDRLAAFTEDARRSGVAVLPPCINRSQADFSVERAGEKLTVRYALAALKNVGEKAMEDVVTGRGDGYAALPDFSKRVDPKLLNKRQLESLIAAGCFDAIDANRAGVYLLAESILGTAQAAADARVSAQAALFGESTDRGLAMLVPNVSWTLAETMAHEKDAFGFYFSGHPVEAWRPVLDAQGALSFADVAALPAPSGGGKKGVVMAGLIEEVRWRTPQTGKGNRYLLITFSDRSGQFVGSCFDEDAQVRIEAIASDAPSVLIQAELLWREGEDVPRVTVRGVTSLTEMAKRARGRVVLAADAAGDAERLAVLVAEARGKGRGELVAEVATMAGVARLCLGRDYLFDAELLARLGRQFGPERISSEAIDPPRLALVG
jgi:DNA polymerase-3 subunit alpha